MSQPAISLHFEMEHMSTSTVLAFVRRLDLHKWGASASAVCSAHCVLTPLVAGVPMIGLDLVLHPACEVGMLLVSSLLALATMLRATVHPARGWWAGVLVVFGVATVWTGHLGVEGPLERMLVFVGASALVAAQLSSAAACGGSCSSAAGRPPNETAPAPTRRAAP